jgi:hypothetical protein
MMDKITNKKKKREEVLNTLLQVCGDPHRRCIPVGYENKFAEILRLLLPFILPSISNSFYCFLLSFSIRFLLPLSFFLLLLLSSLIDLNINI